MGTTGWGERSSPPDGEAGAETMETAGMSAQSLKDKQQEAILDQVIKGWVQQHISRLRYSVPAQ